MKRPQDELLRPENKRCESKPKRKSKELLLPQKLRDKLLLPNNDD
jgi:hypothetical protein